MERSAESPVPVRRSSHKVRRTLFAVGLGIGTTGIATGAAALVSSGGNEAVSSPGGPDYAFSSGSVAERAWNSATVRDQVRKDTALYAEAARIRVHDEIMRQGMIAAKAIHDQKIAEERAAAQKRSAAHHSYSSAVNDSNNGSFLDCVRHRESRGQYGVVNSSSGAAGAYQFMPSTWNNIAHASGREDLVGVNPAAASPADQDAMAQQLYAAEGESPWSGGSYAC